MKTTLTALVIASLGLGLTCGALARNPGASSPAPAAPRAHDSTMPVLAGRDIDTLWIFDADFENLEGDNAGWQAFDISGYPMVDGDYWHKDTIRINGFEYLGDSTWWCGTYCSWWEQSRGYGNKWAQWLYRSIPLGGWSAPGDAVTLEWDQRFAIEHDYDYGYTEVSTDGGDTWVTLYTVTDPDFGGPGMSQDWDSIYWGHPVLDVSTHAGSDLWLRYRFESDMAYSSADEHDNPPRHSVLDGAWQLDNIEWKVNGETVWFDDCDAPGENGWIHHSAPREGAADLIFHRALNPETFRGFACNEPSGWMMAAVDSVTGIFVENQLAVLVSPPIDVSAATDIAAEWSGWVDMPSNTGQYATCWFIESETGLGLDKTAFYRRSGWPLGSGPGWKTEVLEYSPERNWLAAVVYAFQLSSYGTGPYTAGLFTDRLRVGIPVPDAETVFRYERSRWVEDTFNASLDDGTIRVNDTDGVASVHVVASADGGLTWYSKAATLKAWGWEFDIPAEVAGAPAEIDYYIETTDALGNVRTCPADAPNVSYSVRRLPITGSTGDPGMLVIDKRMETLDPVDERFDPRQWDDVTDALDILGYEYDLFRTGEHYITHNGPTNTKAFTHYDTHIWLTGSISSRTLTEDDQSNLSGWLDGSTFGVPRRLILIGDDIGYNMVEMGADQMGLFPMYLEAEFEERHPGGAYVEVPDTTIIIRDGGFGIMDYDDGQCSVRCGCPDLGLVDVIGPAAGGTAFPLLEYETSMTGVRSAGVFRVNMTTGATTVIIPFDLRRMTEGAASGHTDALNDRVALLGNLLQLVGKVPTLPGTDVEEGIVFATALAAPHPNPFNPTTTVSYTVGSPGRVSIKIYDLAGRTVRTLADGAHEAGEYDVLWDGRTDTGDRAASGVYFVRMTAAADDPGGAATGHGSGIRAESRQQKLVLLK